MFARRSQTALSALVIFAFAHTLPAVAQVINPEDDLNYNATPVPSNPVAAVPPAGDAPPAAAGGTPDAGTPDKPKHNVPQLTESQRRKRIMDYLLGPNGYGKILKSRDWISRSIGAICVSGLPGREASDAVLEILKKDTNPVVKLCAWQAMLSRVKYMHLEHYDEWVKASWPLALEGQFKGALRVGLMRMMATTVPDTKAKTVFMQVFDTTNSLDAEDMATLTEMGKCLAAWQSPDIAEKLIERMSKLDDAYRAEYVLKAAGCPVEWARERWKLGSEAMWKQAQADYNKWWSDTKGTWKEKTKSEVAEWRAISPQFVPETPGVETVSVTDPQIKKDLEMNVLGLSGFDVCFAVDATGSMGEVLKWLQRDVKRMMAAFAIVSREPRIGITFYRDHGDLKRDEFVTKSVPLTDNGDSLVKALSEMKAKGGGDIAEAILEGLTEVINGHPWANSPLARKVIVLVGDAPPHPEEEAKTEELVKNAVTKGFRLYAVKVTTEYGANDISTFDALAAAGNGSTVAADFPANTGSFRGLGYLPEKVKSHEQLTVVADARTEETAGEKVLAAVLINAINPQFEERVGPFVRVVLATCDEGIPEKRRPFPPTVEDKPKPQPTPNKYKGDAGGHEAPKPPPKPKDPPPPKKGVQD